MAVVRDQVRRGFFSSRLLTCLALSSLSLPLFPALFVSAPPDLPLSSSPLSSPFAFFGNPAQLNRERPKID